ncbi:hypothetical protein G3I44_14395 [Halogeometricum borinquense]|uniref:Uncharacterized protein n=1 Tax=Halogeometricum borinquense TaxID=60847 RepID=A0A6C0UIP1_9EURY|nr:hypothetical protein [Halogeometricum borinquense]QIB75376.1 hypothetical protein G3I44_14395 [Halogeometricum borinquense]
MLDIALPHMMAAWSLSAVFLSGLVVLGENVGGSASSKLTYLVIGNVIAFAVFWGAVFVLPQVWPIS